jgi:hypothetical protein
MVHVRVRPECIVGQGFNRHNAELKFRSITFASVAGNMYTVD